MSLSIKPTFQLIFIPRRDQPNPLQQSYRLLLQGVEQKDHKRCTKLQEESKRGEESITVR